VDESQEKSQEQIDVEQAKLAEKVSLQHRLKNRRSTPHMETVHLSSEGDPIGLFRPDYSINSGCTVVGAPTLHEAVDEQISDENTTYIFGKAGNSCKIGFGLNRINPDAFATIYVRVAVDSGFSLGLLRMGIFSENDVLIKNLGQSSVFGTNYQTKSFDIDSLDLSLNPYLRINFRTNPGVRVTQVYLEVEDMPVAQIGFDRYMDQSKTDGVFRICDFSGIRDYRNLVWIEKDRLLADTFDVVDSNAFPGTAKAIYLGGDLRDEGTRYALPDRDTTTNITY